MGCPCVNTGPRGIQGPQGIQGPVGPPGEGINVIGSVPNFSDLPTLGVDDLEFWYVEPRTPFISGMVHVG